MRNADLLERSRRAVWHPCTQMKHHETQPLVPIIRGEGAWLFDAEGGRYLDAVSSWWTNLFGHNQPRIKAAIADQMERIEHVMLAGLTHEPVIELSERLATLTGLRHAFYAGDGASALLVLESSLPGVFAVGDVRARSIKRIASAVGEGSMSVAFVHQYLATL